MDVRDAYFQLDPFGPGSGPITGLQVFEEHPTQTTGHWLVKPIVQQCKGMHFIETMLCSGTTIGTRDAMLKYLEVMYAEMKAWISTPKCRFNLNGDDQTVRLDERAIRLPCRLSCTKLTVHFCWATGRFTIIYITLGNCRLQRRSPIDMVL
jgi:hypothetical protein